MLHHLLCFFEGRQHSKVVSPLCSQDGVAEKDTRAQQQFDHHIHSKKYESRTMNSRSAGSDTRLEHVRTGRSACAYILIRMAETNCGLVWARVSHIRVSFPLEVFSKKTKIID